MPDNFDSGLYTVVNQSSLSPIIECPIQKSLVLGDKRDQHLTANNLDGESQREQDLHIILVKQGI